MEQRVLSETLNSEDPAVVLRALNALHRLAEQVDVRGVRLARRNGWSWEQIGDALGVSRQSIHVKYGKQVQRCPKPPGRDVPIAPPRRRFSELCGGNDHRILPRLDHRNSPGVDRSDGLIWS